MSQPGRAEPGVQEIAWNGRMADGRNAPDGIYYAHLVAGARRAVQKVVRISN